VYLRYAYGVFSQVGNLLLRYKLSKRLTIEAGTGESQSMDLLYIVEKP
jgi:autotransporter translocation and assembly factor TamB